MKREGFCVGILYRWTFKSTTRIWYRLWRALYIEIGHAIIEFRQKTIQILVEEEKVCAPFLVRKKYPIKIDISKSIPLNWCSTAQVTGIFEVLFSTVRTPSVIWTIIKIIGTMANRARGCDFAVFLPFHHQIMRRIVRKYASPRWIHWIFIRLLVIAYHHESSPIYKVGKNCPFTPGQVEAARAAWSPAANAP